MAAGAMWVHGTWTISVWAPGGDTAPQPAACRARGIDLVQQSRSSGPHSFLWLPPGVALPLVFMFSVGLILPLDAVGIPLCDLM